MRVLISCFALALIASTPEVWAQTNGSKKRVGVIVVDVAGDLAYLKPGANAGLRAGTEVRLSKRRYQIIAVTSSNAVVRLNGRFMRIGSRGRATVTRRDGNEKRLAVPTPLDAFRNTWKTPSLPAASQSPAPVPIGSIRAGGPTSLRVSASSATWLPLADSPASHVTRASLRAQLHTEPFVDKPFGFDADVAIGRWIGRGLDDDLGSDSRPIIEVQQLRARYGPKGSPFVGLGRLRYAALTVGLLDGARVSSPSFSGVRVAAFGGIVPDSTDGRPSTELARFGAEVSYHAPRHRWRPSAEVVMYGSTFNGSLDERRAATAFHLFPGPLSLSGHTELSLFDSDNPWGSSRVELTAAGLDAALRFKRVDVAASIDVQQPERSRWLASLLPASWLCTSSPAPATATPETESCNGSDNLRYYGLLRAGLRLSRWHVHAGATTVASSGVKLDQKGAFVDLQAARVWRQLSLSIGALVTDSPFVESGALRIAAASPITSSLDLDIFYRPALLRYQAAISDFFEHRTGLNALYRLDSDVSLSLSGEAVLGEDVSALGIFATATWRTSL